MMRSLYSGVSGLKNHQTKMDVIGNNIANVNTTGYKSSRVTFADSLNQMLSGASSSTSTRGGTNPTQIGLGVALASIDVIHTQGNLQSTGTNTDLALQGNGFFILADGNKQYYTRAGNFSLDEDGSYVATNGMRVQGWLADATGNIDTNGATTSIILPLGRTINPSATTEVEFGGNLDSATAPSVSYPNLTIPDSNGADVRLTFTLTPSSTTYNQYNYTVSTSSGTITAGSSGTLTLNLDGTVASITGDPIAVSPANGADAITVNLPTANAANGGSFTVAGTTLASNGSYTAPADLVSSTVIYDSLGDAHIIATTASKTDVNSWAWETTDEAGNVLGNGTLEYGDTGNLIATSGTSIVLNPIGAEQIVIVPDFSNVTQYASSVSELTSPAQNGYAMGALESYSVDKTGTIVGVFSNGLSMTLGQVAVANFNNPAGLISSGSSLFETSNNSGSVQIGVAGMSGRGSISAGTLEMSNVDLASEFTDMITTQRGYQANSRIITTSDDMLEELVNLKR